MTLIPAVVDFARLLRRAGIPVGPGQAIAAVQALEAVSVTSRADFYWALHAVFVGRADQRAVFRDAFDAFWREADRDLEALVAQLPAPTSRLFPSAPEALRRVREAMAEADDTHPTQRESEIRWERTLTYSDREMLAKKDFEQMSLEEVERAKAVLRQLRLPIRPVRTRRYRADPRGARIDMRASLRASARSAGYIHLRKRERVLRSPHLVTICDISGSMERYSRLLLHFLHGVTNTRDRTYTFLFGTRLTNVTRLLQRRDVDEALAAVGDTVGDWSGGTRIGACLASFNRHWSRRVLGQGAVVLLITDGLDRDGGEGLGRQVERLRMSSRKLIWLNPLLRFGGFEPKAAGIRAILPHVDEFRPVHNLKSLEDLASVLSDDAAGRSSSPDARRRLPRPRARPHYPDR